MANYVYYVSFSFRAGNGTMEVTNGRPIESTRQVRDLAEYVRNAIWHHQGSDVGPVRVDGFSLLRTEK